VPTEEYRLFYDPNHLTHLFDHASRLRFQLRCQHRQRQFFAPRQARRPLLLAFVDRQLPAQQQNLQVLFASVHGYTEFFRGTQGMMLFHET
jgi:hypothetical protein